MERYNRNLYFDYLRGIAIIMVVGIHTFGRYGGFDGLHEVINTLIRQVLNLGVPLFFAISGYFLSSKDLSSWDKIKSFWKKQILKVYIPALLWGIPWLLYGVRCGSSPIEQVVLWLCCGLSVLYYIAVTIQYYLLLPIIKKNAPPTGGSQQLLSLV